MAKSPPVPSRRPTPHNTAPAPKRGILSMFTPLNTVLIILALGGGVTLAATQFSRMSPPPPPMPSANAAPIVPPTPTTPPPPARKGISPPPGVFEPLPVVQWEGNAVGSSLSVFVANPPRLGLESAPPGTRVPVNGIDLFTDKATSFSSPTKQYKGYVIGFCCNQSAGYNGAWDGLTEAEKDTYVRSFLK